MGKKLEFIGGFSIIVGFIIILNSIEGITGYAVAGKIYGSFGSFFGIFFLLAGILILIYEKNYSDVKEVHANLK